MYTCLGAIPLSLSSKFAVRRVVDSVHTAEGHNTVWLYRAGGRLLLRSWVGARVLFRVLLSCASCAFVRCSVGTVNKEARGAKHPTCTMTMTPRQRLGLTRDDSNDRTRRVRRSAAVDSSRGCPTDGTLAFACHATNRSHVRPLAISVLTSGRGRTFV